jgi:hypothetical protein
MMHFLVDDSGKVERQMMLLLLPEIPDAKARKEQIGRGRKANLGCHKGALRKAKRIKIKSRK